MSSSLQRTTGAQFCRTPRSLQKILSVIPPRGRETGGSLFLTGSMNSLALLAFSVWPRCSCSQRACSGRGVHVVETGSHRWQGAAHRTGRRGHGWGTGGLYYIHCPSGKGSNLWKLFTQSGEGDDGRENQEARKVSVSPRERSRQYWSLIYYNQDLTFHF